MRFRILGPLQVLGDDGRPLPLRPQQRRLLAVLLLAANQGVTRRRLMDELWGEDPPATARRQVLNCVSALRRRLAGRIVADGSGYRLRIEDGEFDARQFQDRVAAARVLAADGHPARAVSELRDALALWRGPALAGITGTMVEAGAARLDEQRLAATELCLDLELQLDRQHELIGELGELTAAHPLRERLVGLLMLALHRSGRRAEALAAYHRLRTRLADDLGLDPGPEVAALHTAILRNQVEAAETDETDETAAAARAGPRRVGVVPRQLPAGTRHFVGRQDELKELTRLVDERGPDTAVLIVAIDGTAGVGKTALAMHWANQVAHNFPDGQLYVNLRGFDPSGSPVSVAEAVRGFLDAFAVPAGDIPGSLDAQVNLYRSLLSGRRVLVVLDNARDPDQVRPLLPGSGTCLAVVTSRNQLAGLVAGEGAHPVTLTLLSTVEAYELLARHLGERRSAAEPAAVEALVSTCARLPLALAVVAARAAAHPTFPLATFAAELADAHRRLDLLDAGDRTTHLRAVFSWSYRRLGAPAGRLFRLLGLHPGPDIGVPAVVGLAGGTVERVRPLLAELARAHLVTEHSPGRFTFHDLLRAYAAELAESTDPGQERHAALRRLLDHYLHTGHAGALLLDPHRDPITLVEPDPAARPGELADTGQAMAWFTAEHAVLLGLVERAAAAGFDRHAWQLAWVCTTFLYRQGHWQDWVRTQQVALAATRRLTDRAAQAQAHRNLGLAFARLGDDEQAGGQAQCALDLYAALGDLAAQARAHLDFAWLFERAGDHARALPHTSRALELFREAGHRNGEAIALNGLGWLHVQLGDYPQALEHCRQALDLFRELGDRYCEAAVWDSIGYAHHHLGDHGQAVACYERALDLFRELGDRYYEAEVLGRIGDARHAAGGRDEARAAWRQALTLMRQIGHSQVDQVRAKLESADQLGTGVDRSGKQP